MLIETFIYLFPRKELDMDIDPSNRTYEKVPFIFDLNQVASAYLSYDIDIPGIKDPTMIIFNSGESSEIQYSYNTFKDMWKQYKTMSHE